MTRTLAIASVFVLVGGLELTAQQRSSPIPIPRPAPAASRQSTPSTPSSFASTLVFKSPHMRLTPNPFRGINRGAVLPALPFLWGWGVPVFYANATAQVVPLPADAPTGGVQLDVTPWRSSVYVDGALKGRVDDFRGYYRPLTLAAGLHEIAIVERGYEPLVFEVFVIPGRTLTYRATLDDSLSP